MKQKLLVAAIAVAAITSANAAPYRVQVSIENLSPNAGTFQTPHWVGFHDGQFDLYNGGTPADFLPVPNDPRRSIERLAEDGNNGPLAETFAEIAPDGVDGTIVGPNGPIAPGDVAVGNFIIDSEDPAQSYFSYASMILPSNDFWYANGNPRAHRVFDDAGNFVAESFFVTNLDILDAGTEVNTEAPEDTAFFGQQAPDTGIDENGVILDFGDESGLVAFRLPTNPDNPGNILASPRFRMADFVAEGYPLTKISFASAPAITENLDFEAELSGAQEVPAVNTFASGRGIYQLRENGTELIYRNFFRGLRGVTMAHLHLGAEGENGPVVANLLPVDFNATSFQGFLASRIIRGTLTADNLVGPLAGQPLDRLIAEIQAGNIYINIHTRQNPAGELRGQL